MKTKKVEIEVKEGFRIRYYEETDYIRDYYRENIFDTMEEVVDCIAEGLADKTIKKPYSSSCGHSSSLEIEKGQYWNYEGEQFFLPELDISVSDTMEKAKKSDNYVKYLDEKMREDEIEKINIEIQKIKDETHKEFIETIKRWKRNEADMKLAELRVKLTELSGEEKEMEEGYWGWRYKK